MAAPAPISTMLRPSVIEELHTHLSVTLTSLSSPAEVTSLRLRVVTLMQRLKVLSLDGSTEAEFNSLRDRVSSWSKGRGAESASAVEPAHATTAVSSADPIPEDIIANAKVVLRKRYGQAGSLLPYILSVSHEVEAGKDPKDPETKERRIFFILLGALKELSEDEGTPDEKWEFFLGYMLQHEMPKAGFKEQDPVFALAYLLASHGRIREMLTFFSDKAKIEAPVDGSVLDFKYLQEAFLSGTAAVNHIMHVTSDLHAVAEWIYSNVLAAAASPDYKKDARDPSFLARQKAAKKLSKAEMEKHLATHPVYSRIDAKSRMPIYLKTARIRSQVYDTEVGFKDAFDRFIAFMKKDSDLVERIHNNVKAYSKASTTPEKQKILLDVLLKDYEVLLGNRSHVVLLLKNLVSRFEDSIAMDEASCYFLVIGFDPSSGWADVRASDEESFLQSYKKEHPVPDFSLAKWSESIDAVQATWGKLDKNKKTLQVLKLTLAELERNDRDVDFSSREHLVRIRALQEAGIFVIEPSGTCTMSRTIPPMARSISDYLGNEVCLPPTAAVKAIPIAPTLPLPAKEAALTTLDTESLSAAAPAGAGGESAARDVSIKRLLAIAKASTLLARPEAKLAFENGLYYTESLHSLLADAIQTPLNSQQFAELSLDIGVAAFYALEQLITSRILESSSTEASALFERRSHGLMERYLLAGLSQFSHMRDVGPILHKLEGMHTASMDPYGSRREPSLVKRRREFLSASTPAKAATHSRAIIDEGKEALAAISKVLISTLSKAGRKSVDPSDFLNTLAALDSPSAGALAMKHHDATESAAEPTHPNIDRLSSIIISVLDRSKAFETTEKRRSALHHNLQRLTSLMQKLSSPRHLALFSFYSSQVRLVLREVIEEFLCAGSEHKNGEVDQKAIKHDLSALISLLGVSTLTASEVKFVTEAAGQRNAARYDVKMQAHMSPVAGIAKVSYEGAGGAGASASDTDTTEFTMVLSESYRKMRDLLEEELTLAVSICDKVEKQLFKR